MVLQIPPDRWQIKGHSNPEFPQQLAIADTRQMEQVWRADRTSGEDDLTSRRRTMQHIVGHVKDTGRPVRVELNPLHQRTRHDAEIATAAGFVEIGRRGADARRNQTATDVHIVKAAARLRRPVEVVSGRNPQFHRRVAIEVADERTPARHRQRQWTVRSVKVAGATLVILDADEIRQYIGPRPADAALFAPTVVILGLPANGEKSVDRARPTQDFAARPVDPSMVEFWLWLGPEAPIEPRVPDDFARGNPQSQIDFAGARFEKKNTTTRVGGQPGRQRTTGRTGADDDRVPVAFLHGVVRLKNSRS